MAAYEFEKLLLNLNFGARAIGRGLHHRRGQLRCQPFQAIEALANFGRVI